MIPQTKHSITPDDIKAVVEVLESGPIARGPLVPRFESALAEYCGAKYAVVFCNGTVALHAALSAVNATSVISPPLTFCAIANATTISGANLFLTDINGETLTADFYTGPVRCDETHPVFVPMDYAGLPWIGQCPRNHVLLRDACHSLGAKIDGVSVTKFADLAVVSFHPAKVITTSEGGAVLTDDLSTRNLLVRFRDNGRHDGLQFALGLNYHMPEMCAALGLSQLKRIDENVSRRRKIAEAYRAHWKLETRLTLPPHSEEHAYHLFVIQLGEGLLCTRAEFRQHLSENGIGTQIHYVPIYLMPYWSDKFDHSAFPVTNKVYSRILSIPLYPAMTDEEVETVMRVIDDALTKFST